ncbi:hypothetical protein GP486_003260 [Trichoglossum hirsutum]|uniref:Heterokaryon incompatibility domain-containing protein n=1 Tax=Trichoglossum hirsutum TaxID=265104 RepID=A0A9P8RQW8_9PEZI|nr:hypothetical protein GP486_003260 [Trichoglossum hirsutum]
MLCSLCQSIDFRSSPIHQEARIGFVTWDTVDREDAINESAEYYAYDHHPSIEALQAAANAGCHLCIQIRSELFHLRGHESDEEVHKGPIEIRCYLKVDSGIYVLPPKEIVAVAKTPIRDVKVVFDLKHFDSSLATLLREKASNAHPSTGSEDNIKLAVSWLNRCLTTHEQCMISAPPYPQLPTRVLDVLPKGNSGDVCLCSTEGHYGPYVTLSHVWGKAQTITTTLSTFEDRITAIPMESMPQTFQDAVRITREMSIRYLWVDSLCIIQDCPEDWAKESSMMGFYYTNSLFTIAAVSASDGDRGCFMTRNPLKLTPCPININFPGVAQGKYECSFLRPDLGWDPVDETTGFQRPPLWQRAWVVQERLLSARMLRFSDMQISWTCNTEEASERVPEGMPKYINKGGETLRQALFGLRKFVLTDIVGDKLSSKVHPASGTEAELMELYNAWYDLVTLYGKCSLTKEADIFPAISGIATAIANATGDTYLAGLWQHDLHRGLLWTAPDSTKARLQLRHYRAPSWSWASLRGTCNFHVRQILQTGRVRTDLFRISQATSQTLEVNPFGEVISGELRITGLLMRAHPKGFENEEAFRKFSHDEDRQTLFDLERGNAIGFYYPDNDNMRYLTEIWCSPVMTEEKSYHGDHNNQGEIQQRPRRLDAHCLALYPVSKTDGIYMRVGMVWVTDFGWFGDHPMSEFSII